MVRAKSIYYFIYSFMVEVAAGLVWNQSERKAAPQQLNVCARARKTFSPGWDAWCAQWLAVPSLWFLLLRASTVFTPIPGNLLRTALLSLPQCQYTHTQTLYTPAADGLQTNYLLTIRTSFYFFHAPFAADKSFFIVHTRLVQKREC